MLSTEDHYLLYYGVYERLVKFLWKDTREARSLGTPSNSEKFSFYDAAHLLSF